MGRMGSRKDVRNTVTMTEGSSRRTPGQSSPCQCTEHDWWLVLRKLVQHPITPPDHVVTRPQYHDPSRILDQVENGNCAHIRRISRQLGSWPDDTTPPFYSVEDPARKEGCTNHSTPPPLTTSLTFPVTTTQTPSAVERLASLLQGPHPQLIRIGVRNKGCAGLSYHLEYVDKPGRFDEVVEQDGVRVLIDSKALFSIIGSEMDWREDALR